MVRGRTGFLEPRLPRVQQLTHLDHIRAAYGRPLSYPQKDSTMNYGFENPYSIHTERVRLVASHGGTIPERWLEIDNNYEQFKYRQVSYVYDLAQAVINGESEEVLNDLHTLAIAVAMGSQPGTATGQVAGTAEAMIDNHVRQQVTAALVKEYSKVSAENFKKVGDNLALNIQQFRALAEKVDPDVGSDAVVGKPMDVQTAWMNALDLAAELDAGLDALRAAAALEGRILSKSDQLVGLICPTTGTGAERRKLWAAWDSDKRTGKWGALVKAGIDLKPIESVREYRSYARPKAVNKVERVNGGIRQTWVDAEDNTILVDRPL